MPTSYELIAVFLSALGIGLTARKSLWGWPVSLVATLLYGWIFLKAHLYADVVLQAVFCIGILYGWGGWLRDKRYKISTSDFADPLPSRSLRYTTALIECTLTIGIAFFWTLCLTTWSDDPAPILDASLSSASLLAQFWTAQRYRASWLLWMLIDLFYTGLFIQRELYATSALYAVFIPIAFYGYRSWRPGRKHHAHHSAI